MDGSERAAEAKKIAEEKTARSINLVACWSCRGPSETGALFCSTCAAVQPPGQADHFTRLGLSCDYVVDAALLDRRYFERQRLLHPDRFATRTARERALSQQQATALNEAYETLKDPVRRADYVLHLRRIGANPDGCNLVSDPALLMEALEMREELAEATSQEEIATLEERTGRDIEACIADLADIFAADDLEAASRLATRLKYLRKLADDCRARRLKLDGPRGSPIPAQRE
jgi:molecular chaperone HscB